MAAARAASGLAEICYCPPSWDPLRRQFVEAIATDSKSPPFSSGLSAVCVELEPQVTKSVERFMDVSFGSQPEVRALARSLLLEGTCLSVLVVGAYSCLAIAWLAYNYPAINRFSNIVAKLLVFADGCFEPGTTRWKITAGHAWRQVRGTIMGDDEIDWTPRATPLCLEDPMDTRDSLIGHCGEQMPHDVRLALAGPVEAIAPDGTVLCTHTSANSLALVLPMLRSWDGPASVAVFAGDKEAQVGTAALQDWVRGLKEMGLRSVVASLVGPNRRARTAYDQLYPANLLRQAAVDAAVGRWVLLADPGFVPSAGLHRSVAATGDLGAALRAVAASAPTAFVVASFVTPDGAPEALTHEDLVRLVDAGEAAAFDASICPLCRPFAWQWLLLAGGSATRFQQVEPGDLHHPAWLMERSLLPRLPGFLHGLVQARSGAAKTGWTALPCGLKASAEQLRGRAQLLLLPGHFLHRRESALLPGSHWEDLNDWFPLHFFFDILLRRVAASLPPANWTNAAPRSFLLPGRLAEVIPARRLASDVVLLKQGTDTSLTLVVMASTVLASEGLDLLLASVPWTVHGVALGAKDYWAVAMEKVPIFLRQLPEQTLVAIVDAYDVVLLPCSRSIPEEFTKYGKDIVWAADKPCFPNPAVCRSCEDQYPAGHHELEACQRFPNLNGGCYMGRAPALAHALEWMRWNGAAGGRDDQENKWHYYNRFPDRVALDHRQRVFSCLFGRPPENFRVENCSVVSADTGDEICVAHANGGTKFEILAPLLQELASRGCMRLPRERPAHAYAGISYPKFIWW